MMIEEQKVLRSALHHNYNISYTVSVVTLTFSATLNGPALSNTALSQNHVG